MEAGLSSNQVRGGGVGSQDEGNRTSLYCPVHLIPSVNGQGIVCSGLCNQGFRLTCILAGDIDVVERRVEGKMIAKINKTGHICYSHKTGGSAKDAQNDPLCVNRTGTLFAHPAGIIRGVPGPFQFRKIFF